MVLIASRLDRDLKRRFGDESYAAEELVAELGAAFLSASLGLTPDFAISIYCQVLFFLLVLGRNISLNLRVLCVE